MIARSEGRGSGSYFENNAGSFRSEDDRKESLRIGSRAREFVGVADSGCSDFDEGLILLRSLEIDFLNHQ